MEDTAEMIRQQMDETKLQLSDKLESLEHQVSDTVQSTGTAVNATVAAVQETVETVTGAVQDAVQSVSNALDVRRQFDRHPWLVLGGAAVAGYLAYEFLARPAKKPVPLTPEALPQPALPADNVADANRPPAVESAATSSAIAAAYQSGLEQSSWRELRSVAIGALIGIAQDVAAHAVPQVLDYLAARRTGQPPRGSEGLGDRRSTPPTNESADAAQRSPSPPSENLRPFRQPRPK